jgi:hypothetical protein
LTFALLVNAAGFGFNVAIWQVYGGRRSPICALVNAACVAALLVFG